MRHASPQSRFIRIYSAGLDGYSYQTLAYSGRERDVVSNVVITDSTTGIGRGIAEEFGRLGHNVILSGPDDESVDAALVRIGRQPGRIVGHVCDETDLAQIQELWSRAEEVFDSVDIWINNAADAVVSPPVLKASPGQIAAAVTSTMERSIFGNVVAARRMAKQGAGKIFNLLGSDFDRVPGLGVISATQQGLHDYTVALVNQSGGSGVIVGRVLPGMFLTGAIVRSIMENCNFGERRARLNLLVDQVETVSPFLVAKMLEFEKSSDDVRWLTDARVNLRRLRSILGARPDQFERFGL